jgi:iron complex outermembrane receptor protein
MLPSLHTSWLLTDLRSGLRALFAVFTLFALSVATSAAEVTLKSFDVPAGDASTTLKQFAAQAGQQVVFAVRDVRGVQTAAVKGDLPLRAALDRMLANTELVATFDEPSSTFSVRKESEAESKNANRAIAESRARPGDRNDRAGLEQTVVLENYEVTGSRIRGVLGEATAQPVFTYTRQDLDRMSIQSIGELHRYIPQLSVAQWNRSLETSQGQDTSFNDAGRISFGEGMRGLGNNTTLVLVDGRRVNKLGQAQTVLSVEAYDLNGIPMAAVERIEVLTDGASAIYGADALAGVINIILKKEYTGTELTATYRNTFDTDTAYRALQLSHALRLGKLSLGISLNWNKTNSLAPRDRWFSASLDRRPFGGTDNRSQSPGGAGTIRTTDGSNLPGLNSPTAAIPTGSTGVNLTVSDFANAGPIPDRFDAAQFIEYGYRSEWGYRMSGEYEASPVAKIFFEMRGTETKNYSPGSFPIIGRPTTIRLAENYPGNPFGVPIFVERVLWEAHQFAGSTYLINTYSATLGLRGSLWGDWRYQASVNRPWTNYATNGKGGFLISTFRPVVQGTDTSLWPILLNDGRVGSPSAELLEPHFQQRPFQEKPDVWIYDIVADGSVLRLPAGDLKIATGMDLMREAVEFDVDPADTSARLAQGHKREVLGVFGEANIPLVSPSQQVRFIHKLAFNMSARFDEYSDFQSKVVPRVGLMYNPSAWLNIRATYGEGYKVPTLTQLYRPQSTFATTPIGSTFEPVFDRARNNEALTGYRTAVVSGGNAALNPEKSKSLNAGILVDVPFVKGLSFSLDYYDIENIDRVAVPNYQALFDSYPERIERATPTPAEVAAGLAGQVTRINQTTTNISYMRAKGWDVELRYERAFGRFGELHARVTATKPELSEIQIAANTALIDNLPRQPMRSTGALFWKKGRLDFGTVVTRTESYYTGFDINPVQLWDFQAAYEFPSRGNRKWWARPFSDARISIGVINAFDTEPQFFRGNHLGTVDPRGRKYEINFRKRL